VAPILSILEEVLGRELALHMSTLLATGGSLWAEGSIRADRSHLRSLKCVSMPAGTASLKN
jgi:hypothetical protein